jgi:hypothetical protein
MHHGRQQDTLQLHVSACLLLQHLGLLLLLLLQVTTPQAFFAGEMDIMSTTEDVLEQQRRLAPGVHAADYIYQLVR